ncbi:putative dehydrogenase [Paenibacillus endophyticus]|uniref:Putative dehydrogenase n=1 Tax=Paenibacillus endophyticus TaxID=1294268 RepID=A0A7W5GBY1_9BACL|nr:Gfo/Idh/MocA family oxidoreductase [Paenibacillus endophyticus]MBB3154300.1 putative dehydrogenase [Paenibacillus endophyticus]
MIRIGKISYWHVHAWDYTKQAQEHPGTEIVAVWDEIAERGQAAADKLGVDFHANLDEMLQRDDIDAVIVDAPTNRHQEVIVAAAKAGKHIFTEKVIAATLKELNIILDEVAKSNVKLTVSLPRLNDGYTLAIRDILSQGVLGRITLVRARLSHNGATANWLPEHFYSLEECGGGALIDLGCHPMYLTRLFMNEMPQEVSAHFGYVTGKQVEDNAVSILTSASGSIGIVEAGFVNNHSPFTLEVHGTEGSLLYGTPENQLLLRTSAPGADSSEKWTAQSIPPARESAFDQWVQHIENDTTADENVSLAIDLTKLMEASNLSAREHRAVRIDELSK